MAAPSNSAPKMPATPLARPLAFPVESDIRIGAESRSISAEIMSMPATHVGSSSSSSSDAAAEARLIGRAEALLRGAGAASSGSGSSTRVSTSSS